MDPGARAKGALGRDDREGGCERLLIAHNAADFYTLPCHDRYNVFNIYMTAENAMTTRKALRLVSWAGLSAAILGVIYLYFYSAQSDGVRFFIIASAFCGFLANRAASWLKQDDRSSRGKERSLRPTASNAVEENERWSDTAATRSALDYSDRSGDHGGGTDQHQ
jgi:hypothetical protein